MQTLKSGAVWIAAAILAIGPLAHTASGFDEAAFGQLNTQEQLSLILAALQNREGQLQNFSYRISGTFRNLSVKTGEEVKAWGNDAFDMKRKGDKIFLHIAGAREGRTTGEFSASWDGSTSRSLTYRPQYKNPRGLVRDSESDTLSYYRYNAVLGLRIPAGRQGQAVSVVEWLQDAMTEGKPINIELAGIDDRKVVGVKILAGPDYAWRCCFDPDRGFMAVLAEMGPTRSSMKDYNYEATRVLEAKEVNGLWVPTKAICRSGTTVSSEETELLYEVSEFTRGTVSDKDIDIVFPPGTEVVDSIRKIAYRVLPNGGREMLRFGDSDTNDVMDPRLPPVEKALEIAEEYMAKEAQQSSNVPATPKPEAPPPRSAAVAARADWPWFWVGIAVLGLVLALFGARLLLARRRKAA